MIRVALYIRVSTEEQALHGFSLEAQREALTKYAKEHDMEITGVYIDEGITARKKYNRRKEFMRLIEGVKEKSFDLILFTKLDRWFRNISDYYKIQETLETYEVNWKTIFESYDTSTASGRLHINIMLSVAQDEADRTSERIRSVFENKIKNKEIVTGKQPYAYVINNKTIEVDEDKAELIRDIFKYYNDVRSVNATMKHMNQKYNLHKSYDFYRETLRTRKYTGDFRGVPDYYPQIISTDLFDSVQDSKSSYIRENQTMRLYIFSGLIQCKECGLKMNGMQTVTSANKFMTYRCRNAATYHRCSNRLSIREDKIELYLLNNIQLLYDTHVEKLRIQKKNKKKKHIDKSKIKLKLKKLKELYVNDLIDIDDYKKDYNEYMKILSEADLEDTAVTIQEDTEKIGIMIADNQLDTYNKLDRKNQRRFWRGIIKEIIIDNEHNIDVVF
ncbi:recombinase family protein [Lachnoclostridium phytofermentans]|uniref:Resolvase domain n=1 Tax=Lachnoclostridium phytofermentans (strain ATCC 700394 / DSM 18823 / ISDg) TaxID=357809 RepID=A9KQ42_LACP7|nr:recombinase family protein [Lachnoclostridium phytofermentans]ABX43354.1 Resolvase domain [Lachnoclostridium phytofermentans ISDg]